jgi:uncharacterized protein
MKLVKNSRVISRNVKAALKFGERLNGLIGRKKVDRDFVLFIPRCSSIHTFFMSVKIDIIMTDKRGRVVLAKSGVLPGRFAGALRARDTFECAAGFIREKRIKKGDRVAVTGPLTNEKNSAVRKKVRLKLYP